MSDGRVEFDIVGNDQSINQTVKNVTNNIQNESKKWDQAAGNATSDIEKKFANMAGNIVGKLAAAGIGAILLNWGKAAIEAASDLQEVQNVVDTVFGEGSRQIDAWAQKAGEKFGLTETMAKRFTSTLGAMMKSSGLAGDEIVGMSTDLAGLAADMASFYNLDFETAFEKIRSGISGETMPLKQLGINMSVANLEAFALAQGLEKTFSEMDQGEQTMLRYQYLMQATADAQGDFEKTSDGFANAQRRIQSSLASIETSIGKLIIEPFSNATAAVADFLAGIASSMMPEKTVIDEFNDIEVDTSSKLAEIQKTYDSASDLIKILKEIEDKTVQLQDGTTVSLSSLFGDLSEIEKSGGDIEAYVQSLGLDVNYVVGEYNKWKEATRQLTGLVPSLTSVINSETGAIEGGTDALQKNLDEWKRNEENKVYWAEYYAKAEAVARAKGEQAGIQITARAKQLAAERARKNLQGQFEGIEFDAEGKIIAEPSVMNWHGELSPEQLKVRKAWVDQSADYNRLLDEADKAQKEATKSANDLADAESLLADELAAVEEITGETLATHEQGAQDADEATEYLGKTTKDWVDALKNAPEAADAIKAVADYYAGVRDATEQAVNATVKGFEKIKMSWDEQNDLANQETETLNEYADVFNRLGSDNDALKRMEENWDHLSDREKEAHEALVKVRNAQTEFNKAVEQYSPESMISGLQSQIDFMESYLENLNKAEELGLSPELLAQLSDGSKESAEYLAQIANADADTIGNLNSKYAELQEKKKGFTDTLTQNKLTADEVYDALVQKAIEAVGDLNLEELAAASMGDTVLGIAEGIRDNVPEVAAAVDSLLAQLDRLQGFGLSFNFGGGGLEFSFGSDVEHFAGGTDWIPRNNYPAFLDYGEAVLTAEENQIWQRFKNGQQPSSMDYDVLGGVMRDNVKAGGDVYLDGRTVGHVISDHQGRQYRNLKRSGWQG